MEYFLKADNVKSYMEMVSDYDSSYIVSKVLGTIPKGSSILELGMGPGKDLLVLSKYYTVVGSDYSPVFIDNFKSNNITKTHNIKVYVVDAIRVNINMQFDCIYSNKVLHHLTKSDFITSLKNQVTHLNKDGFLFFTLWQGDYREEMMANNTLRFTYYTENDIRELIPPQLSVHSIMHYTEFDTNDSLLVILQLKENI